MINIPDVVFVGGDDWVGLYIDGILHDEGHSISTSHAIIAVKDLGKFTFSTREADPDWLYEMGSFPEELKDVQFVK